MSDQKITAGLEVDGRGPMLLVCSECTKPLSNEKGETPGYLRGSDQALIFPCSHCGYENGTDKTLSMEMGKLPDA